MQYKLYDKFNGDWYKHMENPFEKITEEQKEILRKGLEESEIKEEEIKD
jgi:hypothetical protein